MTHQEFENGSSKNGLFHGQTLTRDRGGKRVCYIVGSNHVGVEGTEHDPERKEVVPLVKGRHLGEALMLVVVVVVVAGECYYCST